MSQPAYAGIAGLSVREFKPTGLQAGWLFRCAWHGAFAEGLV